MTEHDDDVVSFEIRPSTLRFGAGALVIGLVAGFLLGRASTTMPDTVGTPQSAQAAAAPLAEPERFAVSTEGRPARGPADAPVTVVEFTDYDCPFCTRYYRNTYHQLQNEYAGRIRYVVRNYPLPIHPKAPGAAIAAECAAEQGTAAFFAYHDALFEREAELTAELYHRLATDVGLDRADFAGCIESGRTRQTVAVDVAAARELRIRGTPAFFINGRRLYGAQPIEVFRAYIDEELALD